MRARVVEVLTRHGCNVTVVSARIFPLIHAHIWALTPAALYELLTRVASPVDGHGCLNELFRVFSGLDDEAWVNALCVPSLEQVLQGDAGNTTAWRHSRQDCQQVLHTSKSRLASCVVGNVKDPHGTDVQLRHWFPWIAPRGGNRVSQRNTGASRPPDAMAMLSPAQRTVLHGITAFEHEVWHWVDVMDR